MNSADANFDFARLRGETGLQLSEAAEQFGVAFETVCDWEFGESPVPERVLRTLAVLADFSPQRAPDTRDKSPHPAHESSRLAHKVVENSRKDVLQRGSTWQPSFSGFCPIAEASDRLALGGVEERGAIYTRSEVVNFMLDLIGYTADAELEHYRLLEPSFGGGDFLIAAAERLIRAWQARNGRSVEPLLDSIRAVEVHHQTFEDTKSKLHTALLRWGVPLGAALELQHAWLVRGDYLLLDLPGEFSHVVGNPPYVRQELISDVLMAEYRERYSTIYDRADIYIPFIERSLRYLSADGLLSFICADRWMKNKYGGPLRQLIADHYGIAAYVDMVDTPAFHSDVIAYPAITVLTKAKGCVTRIAHRPSIDGAALKRLSEAMRNAKSGSDSGVVEVEKVAVGREPWILKSFDQLALVRRMEASLPLIQDVGCRVGIGVATGADQVFIGRYDGLPVEPDRKLPLVMRRDIQSGSVEWRGEGVINPFEDDGSLVDLADYPLLRQYFEANAAPIKARNCAKRSAHRWYRTIDRIYPELAKRPKLLIPDIAGEAHVVYESGQLYPHHNLYFITADEWDLRALQAVLLSGIARLFVSTYSTQMRGGYLRFQAQYLRRIRLPLWSAVPDAAKVALAEAATGGDSLACNEATYELYGLSASERAMISANGS